MSDKERLDRLAEAFDTSPTLYERFTDLVHEAATQEAENALNDGEGLAFLISLGFDVDDIEESLQ